MAQLEKENAYLHARFAEYEENNQKKDADLKEAVTLMMSQLNMS